MHTLSTFVLLTLCVSSIIALNLDDITPIAERDESPKVGRWVLRDDVDAPLNRIFWEVSDPTHHNYGKFYTASEAQALIAPTATHVFKVLEWLLVAHIPMHSITIFSDYFYVNTTIEKTSTLFNTTFSVYQTYHPYYPYRYVISGPAHIPTELNNIIDFVTGISELTPYSENPVYDDAANFTDNFITPEILKAYYGIPEDTVATNHKNLQGIGSFNDYFSISALRNFEQKYDLPENTVTEHSANHNCLYDDNQCDGVESDLDMQYITAMGAGVPTIFIAQTANEWILDWAHKVVSMKKPPLVNSLSYGFMEEHQCELGLGCTLYGYDYEQYIRRTNTEIQVLGLMGLTILVSDGDNGAPSHGNSNCPMDTSEGNYCIVGGCDHTSSKCGEVFITHPNYTQCIFPMGANSEECSFLLGDSNAIKHLTRMLNLYSELNAPECNSSLEYDNYGGYNLYSNCECEDMQTYDYGNGIIVIPYTYHKKNGPVFSPEYPTSSPYVTSVGATQFTWDGDQITGEIVSQGAKTNALIVTGGGFSNFQEQPEYQKHAVNSWLHSNDSVPPKFAFNHNMRGFPDISFNGHMYQIITEYIDPTSNMTTDPSVCPNCYDIAVDGTSCSSPALAGMLSLINDKLLNAGKSPIGFINPLLYMMAKQHPAAFRDITEGDNKCNSGGLCCKYGYTATTGWDPVSGLGTPVYAEFEKFVLRTKGVSGH